MTDGDWQVQVKNFGCVLSWDVSENVESFIAWFRSSWDSDQASPHHKEGSKSWTEHTLFSLLRSSPGCFWGFFFFQALSLNSVSLSFLLHWVLRNKPIVRDVATIFHGRNKRKLEPCTKKIKVTFSHANILLWWEGVTLQDGHVKVSSSNFIYTRR